MLEVDRVEGEEPSHEVGSGDVHEPLGGIDANAERRETGRVVERERTPDDSTDCGRCRIVRHNESVRRTLCAVRLRAVFKGFAVLVLLFGGFTAITYGAVFIVFGVKWGKAGGLLLLFAGMRMIIGVFDLLWERPPQFSKRPWERPWEHDQSPYG